MDLASGSATQTAIIKETTYGETPSMPDMLIIPVTSFGLVPTREVIESNAITGNRQDLEPRSGNNNVSGDIAGEMQHGTYDLLLESLFGNTFATDTLIVGNDKHSLTVEEGYTDIGQYIQYRGVLVSSAAITIPLDGNSTISFSTMAKSSSLTQTSIANSTTPIAKTAYVHFDGAFTEGGSNLNIMMSLNLNIDTALTQNYALGNRDPISLTSNSFKVTGTSELYFDSESLMNKFLNDQQSSIEFTLTDPSGNSQTWTLPKLKYSGASVPVSNSELLTLSMPFNAYYDAVEGTTIKVQRSAI